MNDATSRPERIAVVLFALARTILCGYRAATQSITVDEATTYLNYVRDHWSNVWTNYDPNNHILYSILAQLSVRALHISEFSLRLPTVISSFFFVIGVYRVLEAAGVSPITRWVTLIAVSLAPLMLDFSVAARGYGVGITFLVWAVYFSIRGRDAWAGLFAGLAVAAIFNLAVSAIGVIACPLVLGNGRFSSRLRRCLAGAVPAAVVFLVICYPVFRELKLSHFYVGEPTITAALYNVVFLTIRSAPGHPGFFGAGTGTRAIQYFFLPAVMLFVVIASGREFLREERSRRSLLPAFTLVLALVAILASHFIAGLNYPVDRLALHLFVLFALAWAIAVSQVANPRVRVLNALLAIALIAQFVTQFHTAYFALWTFDAPMNKVAQRIRDDVGGKPPGSVSVSVTWFNTPSMEFYRNVYRIKALQPIERREPTPLVGFDYYVLNGDDRPLKAALTPAIVPLINDNLSGLVLTK